MLWTEDAPTHCLNGHRLGPNRVLVGWLAPRAGILEQGAIVASLVLAPLSLATGGMLGSV